MLKRLREAIQRVEAFGNQYVSLLNGLEAIKEQVEGLQGIVGGLEARQADLEREMRGAVLEYAELHGKTYRLLKRVEMQNRRAAEEEPAEPVEEPEVVDPVSARINARREARRGLSIRRNAG